MCGRYTLRRSDLALFALNAVPEPGFETKPIPLDLFPKPDELRQRYEKAKGYSLDGPAAAPLLRPYEGGEGGRRY